MLNKEELISILKIENSTNFKNEDNEMIYYIKDRLTTMGITFEEQITKYSHNIFSIHDNRPLICCHTDSMKMTSADAKFKKNSGSHPLSVFENDKGQIVAKRDNKKSVLGGDDGCGIFILLNLLENGEDISFAFFSNEEMGMYGSRLFPKERLATIPYCLVIDRMGNDNIICSKNNYGSKEFEDALVEVGAQYGFHQQRGFCSDADSLREYISCANLSCGYYDAHSCNEYVIYDDVIKTFEYVTNIIREFNGREFPKNTNLASAFIEENITDITKKIFGKFRTEYMFYVSEENISQIMINAIKAINKK